MFFTKGDRKMSYNTFGKQGISSTDRTFAMAIWVSSFFTAFIGPLIIWLIKKDDSEFINYHGREYFNMLLSYFIYYVIAAILTLIIIGPFIAAALSVVQFIFTVIAAVKAFDGQLYRLPLVIHFFR